MACPHQVLKVASIQKWHLRHACANLVITFKTLDITSGAKVLIEEVNLGSSRGDYIMYPFSLNAQMTFHFVYYIVCIFYITKSGSKALYIGYSPYILSLGSFTNYVDKRR